ncbi:MAG TPA: hypothetical protein VL330_17335 [Actinomycetes bacterium]|nr:hypothetical protein [Actinomycetes bacterium]
MPEHVVGHVALEDHVAGAVDGHAPVEAVVDAQVLEVAAAGVAHHVEVDRVAAQHPPLAHPVQLHPGHAQLAAHDHHLAAEPGRLAGRVALDAQVAGEQADLAPLVEGAAAVALQPAPVAEA